MTDNTKIAAFEPPISRKVSGRRRVSDDDGLAPTPDFGPWRKEIGPTMRVRPINLRLFGELALKKTGVTRADLRFA